ncbi:MAG: DUF998 domain-containing protein [Sulfolobaceae archaeon]
MYKPNRATTAGYLILIGSTQFILFMNIAEFLYPNYSVRDNYISDLGVDPSSALIFNLSIIAFGLLVISAFYILREIWYYPLGIIMGTGLCCVGLFPEYTGILHDLSAFIVFLLGGLGAIITGLPSLFGIKNYPGNLNILWIILGILSIISLIFFTLGFITSNDAYYLGLGKGGIERLIAYPELVWAISFSSTLINNKN